MALDKLPVTPSRLGKYELLKEQAGSGTMGATWLARIHGDPAEATRVYSLLRAPKHSVKKPETFDAFLAELKQAERLIHPNAASMIEVGTIDGEPFAVSELDDGESLSTLITVSGKDGLPLPIVLRIFLDVLEALSAAHALSPPLVHGELTPQHIRVGLNGVSKITGFGVARALSRLSSVGAKNYDRLAYAAPERVKAMSLGDAPATDPRADIFSIGVMLWEALGKQRLFASRIDAAIIQKVLTAPIGGLGEQGVPPELDEAVQKSLDRDPARRFQNVNDLIMGLEGAGPDKIATTQQAAAMVEKLAGKAIAARRAELDALAPKKNGATPAVPAAETSGLRPRTDAAAAPTPSPTAAAPKAPTPPAGLPAIEKPAADKPAVPAAPSAVARALPARKPTLVGGVVPAPVVTKPAAPAKPTVPSAGAAEKPATPEAPAIKAAPQADKPSPASARSPEPSPPISSKPASSGKAAAKPAAPAAKPAAKSATESAEDFDVEVDADFEAPPVSGDKSPANAAARVDSEPVSLDPVSLDLASDKAEPSPKAPAVAKSPPAPAAKAPAKPPPVRKGVPTLLMGSNAAKINLPDAKTPAPDKVAEAKPAEAKPAEAKPEGKPAVAEKAAEKPAAPEKPAPEKATEKAAVEKAPSEKVAEKAAVEKTEATPSDGPSPRGRTATSIDRLGPGSTLGRYEILMPVARGGMASVWAARLQGSRGFQKVVAVKTMLPDVSDDPDFETMFLDEARVAARIRHPNVVEILDLGEQDDVLYLVMEWVEGENLTVLMKHARAHGGIPLPITLRIASQACAGLHAAHELRDDAGNLVDLVHRDISPANIIVSTQGFVKIVDFGVAKSKARIYATRAGGMVKGKTPYLSPEQLTQQPLDRRSDIFSFGALLYVLATGLHPFRGDSEIKTVENIALREPVKLREIVPAIPEEFEQIVLKTLAKDPQQRFATAAELQRALDALAASLGGTPTTEEDVATFVRNVIGDLQAKRAQDLKSAIAAVDVGASPEIGKGDGAKASESPKPQASGDGARALRAEMPTQPASPEDVEAQEKAAMAAAAKESEAAAEPPAKAEAPAAEAPAKAADVAASAAADAADDESPFAPRRGAKTKYIAAAIGGVAILGVVALMAGGGSKNDAHTAATATATVAAPTATPAAVAPSAAPTQAAAAPTAEPTATATATADAPTAATGQPTAEPPATAEPVAATPPAGARPAKNTFAPTKAPSKGPAKAPPTKAPGKNTKKYNPTGI